jgi:putative endonuclease
MFKSYYVYILECSDLSYYTGVTNDPDRRLLEHQFDEEPTSYTFSRRPVLLKYVSQFQFIHDAIEFEKQIKGWSRAKKEALFHEDWEEIVRLSNLKTTSRDAALRQAQDDILGERTRSGNSQRPILKKIGKK